MSWQTPLRRFHASWADVCTPVDPGTYATSARTNSAIASAASIGVAPCNPAAIDSSSSEIDVCGVAESNSACSSAAAASSAQLTGVTGGGFVI